MLVHGGFLPSHRHGNQNGAEPRHKILLFLAQPNHVNLFGLLFGLEHKESLRQ